MAGSIARARLSGSVLQPQFSDRLIFHANALLPTGETDETGHKIVRNAMTEHQAILASVQNLSHPILWMWPDVVLFISAFFMTAPWFQMLRDRKIKTVILNTESPYLPG